MVGPFSEGGPCPAWSIGTSVLHPFGVNPCRPTGLLTARCRRTSCPVCHRCVMGRPTNHPHIVGLGEVAARCGVSRSTVNRNRAKLEENGAWKDDAGAWHVPVSALLGLGWSPTPDTSAGASSDVPPVSHGTSERDAELAQLQARVSELEARLAVVQAEADKWQAIAAERSLALEDLRRSLLLLETARTRSPEPEPEPARPVVTAPEPPRAGGVFSRFRRR